jgi:isopropylmalate/homocitrate/citramalate synthase
MRSDERHAVTHPKPVLYEVASRDGIQNEKVLLATSEKIELVERAIAAGLRHFEVTSFVNPKRVPQMADAEAVLAGLRHHRGVALQGLVLNPRGIERAPGSGATSVNCVIIASDEFSRRNQGATTAENLAQLPGVVAAARAVGLHVTISIGASFGCPFTGEMPIAHVLSVAEKALALNPDEIAFADTIGCGVPSQVRALLTGTRAMAPAMKIRFHLHNTRNTGIANAIAAFEAGADALDSAIGGFGGCPFAPRATGNIATEDLVYALERMGVSTAIDLDALIRTAEWLAAKLGKPVQSALANAGGFPAARAA